MRRPVARQHYRQTHAARCFTSTTRHSVCDSVPGGRNVFRVALLQLDKGLSAGDERAQTPSVPSRLVYEGQWLRRLAAQRYRRAAGLGCVSEVAIASEPEGHHGTRAARPFDLQLARLPFV